MFDNLSDKLQFVFQKIKGHARISEDNIKDAVRSIRIALLEADVNYKVVKLFIDNVQNRALGSEVLKSLKPDQVFIKIVNDALIEVLGEEQEVTKIKSVSKRPTIIMLVGLQGSGKTTTAGKLALYLQKKKKNILLTSVDIYRPAALDQLRILGNSLSLDVFPLKGDGDCSEDIVSVERASLDGSEALTIVKNSIEYAKRLAKDVVIIDTAGRLHVDEVMMQELKNIASEIQVDEILFVADAMTGQDAINEAKAFNDSLDISGIILTKLDGDARGGAALSIKHVIGKSIKFIGMGEKMENLEPFYADRMASRILGMGDIVSFVEKATEAMDESAAEKMANRVMKDGMDFNDLLNQFKMIKKMGSLGSIMKLIPGFSNFAKADVDDNRLKKVEAVITSMTSIERRRAKILNSSRKKRIAAGSGTKVSEVNKLIMQLEQMNKVLKKINKKYKNSSKIDSEMLKKILPMR